MEYYKLTPITHVREVNGVTNTYYGRWFRDENESIILQVSGQNSLDMGPVELEDSQAAAESLFELFFSQREAGRAAPSGTTE